MSYLLINTLFTNVLQKSKAIEGRFFICSHNGQEINTDNLEQLITGATQKLAKKYPLTLMMPPRSVGKITAKQVEWEQYKIQTFWLKPSFYDKNGVLNPNPRTQTTTHTIPQTWEEMKPVAVNFLRVVDKVIQAKGLQANSVRLPNEDRYFAPVSNIGADNVAGVQMDFHIEVLASCDITDYNPDDINLITV